jgi:hypothetical protein
MSEEKKDDNVGINWDQVGNKADKLEEEIAKDLHKFKESLKKKIRDALDAEERKK